MKALTLVRCSTVAAFALALISTAVEAGADPKPESLMAEISAAGFRQMKTPLLELQGRFEEFDLGESGKIDKLRGYADFTTTIDLGAKDTIRYDYHPRGNRWEDGVAPFLEKRGVIVNDGKVWCDLVERSGPQSKDLYPAKIATIRESPPLFVTVQRLETGEGMFFTRARDQLGNPLFRSLAGLSKTKKCEIQQDGDVVSIVVFDDCTKETMQLRRSLGFALVKHSLETNLCIPDRKPNRETIEFSEHEEVFPGMFVPKAATLLGENRGVPQFRKEVKIAKVGLVANPPSEGLFRADITEGWKVHDERFGVRFNVGEKPNVILEKLRKVLK